METILSMSQWFKFMKMWVLYLTILTITDYCFGPTFMFFVIIHAYENVGSNDSLSTEFLQHQDVINFAHIYLVIHLFALWTFLYNFCHLRVASSGGSGVIWPKSSANVFCILDLMNVMTWKHFLHHLTCMRGIYVIGGFPTKKGQWCRASICDLLLTWTRC